MSRRQKFSKAPSWLGSMASVGMATVAASAHAQPRATPPGDETPSAREQELQDRVDQLERRVNELESATVLSEPQTTVKEIQVYVDENGVEYDEPGPGRRPVVTYQRERTYRRQTINEKLDEALDDAASRSVGLGVDAAIVLQNAQQTSGPKMPADGETYELASADLFFTAGLAQNTIFYADIVGLSGTPPDNEVGGLTLLNGYAARLVRQNELSLREAWLMTELANQRIQLTAGRLDLTNYFDHNAVANDETTQFISDALVNNPMLGLSENGAGLAAVFDPKNGFTAKIGYQQSSSTAVNLSDSLFYLAEVGKLVTLGNLGEGSYRLWYRTDNSGGVNQTGWGISADQKLNQALTLFARVGKAETAGPDDEFFSLGLQFKNGLTFNPEDAWGVGFANTELGSADEEDLIEGYYNLRMTQKLQLSFHLTHVTEKPFGTDEVSYFVPGVRLQASF
jgi:hypothetical protein